MLIILIPVIFIILLYLSVDMLKYEKSLIIPTPTLGNLDPSLPKLLHITTPIGEKSIFHLRNKLDLSVKMPIIASISSVQGYRRGNKSEKFIYFPDGSWHRLTNDPKPPPPQLNIKDNMLYWNDIAPLYLVIKNNGYITYEMTTNTFYPYQDSYSYAIMGINNAGFGEKAYII